MIDSMSPYEDTPEENERSCGYVGSGPGMHSCEMEYNEQHIVSGADLSD